LETIRKWNHKSLSCYMFQRSRTVPAVDFEDRKVWCLIRDNPKSQTCG
jgi:hypothetical protein